MDIKTEQRAYRESRPSALGRGIERLTSPVGKKLAKLVPSSLVRMVLKRLDDASGAAQLYNFEHNRSNLAACRKAAGKVEKVAMSINASTGAASGFGGLFTMGLDVPATVGLAMRNIRDTGRAYGFTGEGEAEQIFRKAYALDNGESDAIRDNLRLALAKTEKSVITEVNEDNYKLVRRGSGDYLIRPTP